MAIVRMRHLRAAAMGVVFLLAPSAAVQADEKSARRAIAQAEAKIDLAKQEGPTRSEEAFLTATDKLAEARVLFRDDKDTRAEWRADEAALLAELAIARTRLNRVEKSRRELADAVEDLRAELEVAERRQGVRR